MTRQSKAKWLIKEISKAIINLLIAFIGWYLFFTQVVDLNQQLILSLTVVSAMAFISAIIVYIWSKYERFFSDHSLKTTSWWEPLSRSTIIKLVAKVGLIMVGGITGLLAVTELLIPNTNLFFAIITGFISVCCFAGSIPLWKKMT